MNFGAELDDDLFETPKNKNDETSGVYEPKIYNNEWFNKDSNCEDGISILKFQADFLYYQHRYRESAEKYLRCLDLLDDSNMTVKRDCLEGISRSFLCLEDHREAIQYALQLHSSSQNIDQNITDWNLLATIYHKMGRYEDELKLLQNCLTYHPWNYDFWIRIAFCYSGMFRIEFNSKLQSSLLNIPKSNRTLADKQSKHLENDTRDNFTDESKDYRTAEVQICKQENNTLETKCSTYNLMCGKESLIVCACLIRARVLLQTCILGYRSFALKNNSQQQKLINELISTMDIDDEFIKDMTEIYLRELNIKISDAENVCHPKVLSDKESTQSQMQFEIMWFGWILRN
ncbi:uncharacterized protein C8orf76-like [Centruroides sculpturatus]|uniref:uncharacterized protein C8orf76-like n=1 Tax=Centruroides sculpturatus TaxID=218467 RepID=UPI000C6D3DD0|nr:uncharacterized protein C8orf76-like [Centruroides sculpturatus]